MINRLRHRTARASRTLAVVLALGSVAVLCESGCRRRPSSGPDTAPSSPGAPAEANQPAVTVNGVSVTKGRVEALVQERIRPFAARMAQLPPEFEAQRRREKRREVVEEIIIKQLLDEQVRALGIAVSAEDVEQAIANMAARQQPPMSSQEFLAKVRAGGQAIDRFREDLHRDLSHLRLCERQWAGKTDASDQEAQSYYARHADQEFQEPESVRASHILIKPDPQADPNHAMASARARAEGLLSQIRDGADFA